jgi:hypothetical protein
MCALQVALKAAQKQLAAVQAPAQQDTPPRSRTGSRSSSGNGRTNTTQGAAASSTANDSSGGSNSIGGSSVGVDAGMAQKLGELEGALRQATSDYALILRELGALRAEGSSRQAGLDAALAGRAAAEAEVHR